MCSLYVEQQKLDIPIKTWLIKAVLSKDPVFRLLSRNGEWACKMQCGLYSTGYRVALVTQTASVFLKPAKHPLTQEYCFIQTESSQRAVVGAPAPCLALCKTACTCADAVVTDCPDAPSATAASFWVGSGENGWILLTQKVITCAEQYSSFTEKLVKGKHNEIIHHS